ncbi:hypothetical protein FA13DRAFT_1724663, partial [Coprinellus micaceus]
MSSALLFVWSPGHRSAMFLGSPAPHHTPTPAFEPSCPLPLHAPSLYTTSQSGPTTIFGLAATPRVGLELEGPATSMPRTNASASSLVGNFLNAGPGKPLVCCSHSFQVL